jgi:hypothetical protein
VNVSQKTETPDGSITGTIKGRDEETIPIYVFDLPTKTQQESTAFQKTKCENSDHALTANVVGSNLKTIRTTGTLTTAMKAEMSAA